MPNVQRLLADEGATFSQYVVSYSLCCPSRATMMTGQYAHNHRVLDNQLPNGGFYRFRPRQLAARLAEGQRLLHGPRRQVPERLRAQEPDQGAAGLERVVHDHRPDHVPLLGLHDERERQARSLRGSDARLHHRRGRAPRDDDHPPPRGEPEDEQEAALPAGRLRRAAQRRSRSSWTTRRGWRRLRPRRGTATASSSPRCRCRRTTTRRT